MIRKWVTLMVFFLLFVHCERLHELFPTGPSPIRTQSALVIVSENAGNVAPVLSWGYYYSQTEVLAIFEDLLGVDQAILDTLTLDEIIEQYWEEWAIQQLELAASDSYDVVISLTDETATAESLLDHFSDLRARNFIIDAVFCLHGSEELICFSDKRMRIELFIEKMIHRKISLRALYQTCCHGSKTIDLWETTGIRAVNGAVGENYVSLFSPAYFMQEWISGLPFNEAVNLAREREIDYIFGFRDQIPLLAYVLGTSVLEESRHEFGGKTPDLLWQNKSEWQR